MNYQVLLREAFATTWANKVPTILVCLITAAMCVMTISTVGRTAAAEEQVAERINSAGARELVITDMKSAGLFGPSLISMASRFSVTDRAVGLGSPVDLKNTVIGQAGTPVPAWGVIGDLSAVATLKEGRWPQPGEALVSHLALQTLGLQHPVGSTSIANSNLAADYAVVGSFIPREPFTDLGKGMIYPAPAGSTATNLHLILADARQAKIAQGSVIGLLGPLNDPDSIAVRSPVQMTQLHDQIVGDLGSFGRSLLYGALGIGALLVAIVVFADILVRRKDLGRRRALGATRENIIGLMLLRTLIPAADFCVGIIVLAMLAAGLSSLAPAAYAAHSDPVKVLRTP